MQHRASAERLAQRAPRYTETMLDPEPGAGRPAHPRRAPRSRPTSSGPSHTIRASSCRSRPTGSSGTWSRPSPRRSSSLADYLAILHHWTEKIQSSPAAIERSVYEVIGKEFRSSGVSLIELRFNPMKRNLGGERDLDHIIHAALRGMDRACLEYGVRAGLIFCLAREFSLELNEILVKKAVKYKSARRGRHRSRRARVTHAGAGRRGRRLPRSVRARARRRRWAPPCTPARRRTPRCRACSPCSRSWRRRASATASPRRTARRRWQAGRVGDGAGDLPELEPAHARGARTSRSSGRRCARSRAPACATRSTPTGRTCSTRTCAASTRC